MPIKLKIGQTIIFRQSTCGIGKSLNPVIDFKSKKDKAKYNKSWNDYVKHSKKIAK